MSDGGGTSQGPRVRLRNVPQVDEKLIGRDATIREILDALSSKRVVVVDGARGIGKTALAKHATHGAIKSDTFTAVVWTTAKDTTLRLEAVLDAIALTL